MLVALAVYRYGMFVLADYCNRMDFGTKADLPFVKA